MCSTLIIVCNLGPCKGPVIDFNSSLAYHVVTFLCESTDSWEWTPCLTVVRWYCIGLNMSAIRNSNNLMQFVLATFIVPFAHIDWRKSGIDTVCTITVICGQNVFKPNKKVPNNIDMLWLAFVAATRCNTDRVGFEDGRLPLDW